MQFRLLTLVSQFKKKTEYDTKVKDIDDKTSDHDKYIVTNDFNKFLGTIFHKRLKETKLRT